MTHTAVLGLGSNSVDSERQMRQCIQWLTASFRSVMASTVYSTPALNGVDADYLNAVAVVVCDVDCQEFNARLKRYEQSCGRTSESKKHGMVPIDVDIVLFDGRVLRPADYGRYYFARGWDELCKK